MIEGGLSVRMGDEVFEARAGSFVFQPRGIPHTFRSSSDGARVLLLVVPSGFEGFFRAMSRPAETMTLPPPVGPPSPEQIAAMEAALAEHGCFLARSGLAALACRLFAVHLVPGHVLRDGFRTGTLSSAAERQTAPS